MGLTVLPLALSTRSFILLDGHSSYPSWLSWTVVGVLLTGWCSNWVGWIIVTRKTMDVRVVDFPIFNLGLLGIRLPRGQVHEKNFKAAQVPYMK